MVKKVPLTSPTAGRLKQTASAEVDKHRAGLRALALRIHAHPETAFKETRAAAWLAGYLEKKGFIVERAAGGLPTAFKATYGKGKPVIALLAEYDALPELGHGCGHNLIAGAAVGAGLASKPAVDALGGTVIVMGTPAEELGAGKAIMIEKGAFTGIDAAMMIHPQAWDLAAPKSTALASLTVEFFGKEAHAGTSPDQGINALEALVQSFVAVNSLRQRLRNQGSVHGIITDGGRVANVIPGHSAAEFVLRAADNPGLEKIKELVIDCFTGAATASGTRLSYKWGIRLDATRSNKTLAGAYAGNMKALGRSVLMDDPRPNPASTDLGNVSQLIPTIQPLVAIIPPTVRGHTREMAAAAASDAGIKGMLDGAKALGMTVVDILTDAHLLESAKAEHTGQATR